MTDRERLKELENRMDNVEQAYIDEVKELTKQKGYDIEKPKWKKKLEKIAQKYAEFTDVFIEEYNQLVEKVNKELGIDVITPKDPFEGIEEE